MRGSRIPHPAGARHIKVWRWAVDAVGKDAAAVLGEIEWRDRMEDAPGQPVATRTALLAALEGFVSRNGVDNSLALLCKLGWIRRHERSTLGERNIRNWLEFSLSADVISEHLKTPPVSLDGETGVPHPEKSPTSPGGEVGTPPAGTGAGTDAGNSSNCALSRTPHTTAATVVCGAAAQHAEAITSAAADAQLSDVDTQRLADVLAGALALPAGDKGRPGNVKRWLATVASTLVSGDFVEGGAFHAGRATRQAALARDPAARAAAETEHQLRLDKSAAAVNALAAAQRAA